MGQTVKVPLKLTPQPEGGYTVTSPLLPELITEGDTVAEVLANVQDALAAVVELYEDSERPLPSQANVVPDKNTLEFETLLSIQ
jgi:antitoxin HicB